MSAAMAAPPLGVLERVPVAQLRVGEVLAPAAGHAGGEVRALVRTGGPETHVLVGEPSREWVEVREHVGVTVVRPPLRPPRPRP